MSVAGNYAGGVAPVAGDQVIFDAAFGGVNPAFLTPVADAAFVGTLYSLQLNGNYNGNVTLNRDLTVNQVSASTSGFAFSQRITINAGRTLTATSVTMTGASVAGAGTLSIAGAANAPGSFVEAAGITLPTIGVGSLTIDANSSMTLNSGVKFDGVALTNNGLIQWNLGNITTGAASTVTNKNTITVSGGDHTYAAGADFTNNGTFTVMLTDSSKSLTFNSAFTHATPAGAAPPVPAFVNVMSGNLRLTGADTVSAVMSVGGALYITGTFTASAGASINGAGTVEVNGGAGILSAAAGLNFAISPLLRLINTGDIRGAGSFQLNGGLFSQDGFINGTTVVASSMNCSSTILGGGGMGLTVNNASLQFNGGTWTSGQILLLNISTLRNAGAFNISSTDDMNARVADTSTFENSASGTVTFAGAGTKVFTCAITSAGTMNLAGQTIQFKKGISQTGGSVVLGGGTIDLTLNQTYTISGGVFNANGTMNNGNLIVQGGTLELSGVLALTGNLTLNAGGTLQVDTNAVGPWGRVNITGNATLAGTLAVVIQGGIVPPAGAQTILTATGGAVGAFAVLPPPAVWKVNRPNANTVELEKL